PPPGCCKSEWWKMARGASIVVLSVAIERKEGNGFYASNGVPSLLPNLFLNS
ncbi:hypothetical protein A2U01_0103877, partial [Trifolium medium]|nr:hypothetical protein [Trifolium medium]